MIKKNIEDTNCGDHSSRLQLSIKYDFLQAISKRRRRSMRTEGTLMETNRPRDENPVEGVLFPLIGSKENVFKESIIKKSKERRLQRLKQSIKHDLSCQTRSLNLFPGIQGARLAAGNFTDLRDMKKASLLKRQKTCSLRFLGKLIIYASRLLSNISIYSYEITPKTLAMQACSCVDSVSQTIEFNKFLFMRTSNIIPQAARDVMEKPPQERSFEDIFILQRVLQNLSQFHDKFTHSVETVMCKTFTYIRVAKNRVILRTGHIGLNFYLIISGSVFVNKQIFDTHECANKWKTIKVMGRGESFGEIALLTQESRRTTTIITKEDCELLVVPRDVFSEMCPKALDEELHEKLKICRNNRIFKSWSSEAIRRVCLDSRVTQYGTGTVIADGENHPQKWMYICMEGKCMVVKKLTMSAKYETNELSTYPKNTKRSIQPLIYTELMKSNSEKLNKQFLKYQTDCLANISSVDDVCTQKSKNLVEERRHSIFDESTWLVSDKHEEMEFRISGNFFKNILKQQPETAFLCVGYLEKSEIFNLFDFLNPFAMEDAILISLGSKVLKLRRDTFFFYATKKDLKIAKEEALKLRLPTQEELRKTYIQDKAWEAYRSRVVNDVLKKRTRPSLLFPKLSDNKV